GSPALFLSHATAPTQIYTLSLHDALPISIGNSRKSIGSQGDAVRAGVEVFTCNNNGYSGERTHNDGVQKRLPCSNQAFFSRTTVLGHAVCQSRGANTSDVGEQGTLNTDDGHT